MDDFNPEAARTVVWTRKNLSDESLAWLSGPAQRPDRGGGAVHAGSRQPTRFGVGVHSGSVSSRGITSRRASSLRLLPGGSHARASALHPARWRIPRCGRGKPVSGEALHLPDQGRAILNPGSVGQPRDGDPRAAYAILDTVEGDVATAPGGLPDRDHPGPHARRRPAGAADHAAVIWLVEGQRGIIGITGAAVHRRLAALRSVAAGFRLSSLPPSCAETHRAFEK